LHEKELNWETWGKNIEETIEYAIAKQTEKT